MKTREDYLSGKCSHREYYSQFVTEGIKDLVISRFSIERLTMSFNTNPDFNSIPLTEWDTLSYNLKHFHSLQNKFKEAGDYRTLGGSVCILKEAARQIVETAIKS